MPDLQGWCEGQVSMQTAGDLIMAVSTCLVKEIYIPRLLGTH